MKTAAQAGMGDPAVEPNGAVGRPAPNAESYCLGKQLRPFNPSALLRAGKPKVTNRAELRYSDG